ncbi:MAG: 4-hydroxy-3-methylbut-2-enyl diphosphate reductase [Butyrivibrio sp.]|nr:4-hydroxy-3-methylbut-2-enyl diphosphate reductase [Butyrivibrio sp.]
MEVITAGSAGFCFGVKRAVEMVYGLLDGGGRVYTYGPIIHNEEVVRDLEARGVAVLSSPSEIKSAAVGTVVIRAHGVPEEIYRCIADSGHTLADATCPFVLKIHKIVREAARRGEYVVIIGDKEHPEIKGIKSCVPDESTVLASEKQAEIFAENEKNRAKRLCVVAQTTYNYNKFKDIVEIFRKNSYYVNVLNTICNATEERQSEAADIAARVDAMIVIGGRNSSNTQKLYEICKDRCADTFYIQTLADMDFDRLKGCARVGITAGASTPNNIIEEVQTQCRI